MQRPNHVPPPWREPWWQPAVDAWIAERLSELGLQQTGLMEPRARPWSIVIRVPTSEGPCWFKTTAPGMTDDAGLTAFLANIGSALVLRPVALDRERQWMLLPDGGHRLRDVITVDDVLDHWTQILPAYGQLQRDTEGREAALFDSGVVDRRPHQLPNLLAGLLDEPYWLRVDEPDGLSRDQLAVLHALLPRLGEAADELASAGIGCSIQHDDLHDGNVVVGADGYRIIDWGDAGVGHPFASLLVTLRAVGDAARLGEWSPFGPVPRELDRLRDAYLEPWTDRAPRSRLNRLVSLATWTGMISRAMAWHSALPLADDEELAEFGGAIPAWLAELSSVVPA